MTGLVSAVDELETTWPDWVPDKARRYLDHTETGRSLRAIARAAGSHPSTVLRQVRRTEEARRDPLLDQGFDRLRSSLTPRTDKKETSVMSFFARDLSLPDTDTVEREARRILRRLSETDAVLVVSETMEQAVVLRTARDVPLRTATVDRRVAEAFAVNDWIKLRTRGRVLQYEITDAGRAALKRLLEADVARRKGQAQETPYADQHRDFALSQRKDEKGARLRVNMAESPLVMLSRRADREGRPFLTEALVAAGERLREDFELAQMGPRVTQNWDRFLTAEDRSNFPRGGGICEGPSGARARVQAALADLGPGLGDVALRCCCHLEGLEACEKRLGWSARSGKIVLRIALQRLARHYASLNGGTAPLIG